MNILFVATEAVPYAKTGGLADVCGALPIELARLGHQVAVIMPAFRSVYRAGRQIEDLDVSVEIPIGGKTVRGSFCRGTLPDSEVPVYFVKQDEYYDREGLYSDASGDYKDNCERFVFFCRAALEAIRLLELEVDVLHAHDWMSALATVYLSEEYRGVPGYEQIASLYTIHNLAYQGTFWHWDMLLTGLDWKLFNWKQMEFYGNLNLMKSGLAFADQLSTVSPRYAQEIQYAPLGCALEGVLQSRRDALTGIVNGVDYTYWNPQTDTAIARQYGPEDFFVGKAVCKQALQAEFHLPERADAPLIGFVGRLADQKGLDLIEEVLREWVESSDAQWVFLGTGDPKYHRVLDTFAQRYPQKVAVRLAFSDAIAHRIEAGADMFLMPSRYEPCGLNQMYSLKYGAVPIVRATGGLADTITDANEQTLAAGTANGFSFEDYSSAALAHALGRAAETYRRQPEAWRKIIENGMRQDWSWSQSARKYVELYRKTAATRRQGAATAR